MLNNYASFSERELNTKETKKLNKELDAIKAKKLFLGKFLIGWIIVAVFVGVIAFFKLEKVELHYLLLGCVLIYILIGYSVYYEQRKAIIAKQDELNYVLTNNKMKFVKVRVLNYIELPEKEDEGTYYLFQLPNEKILSMGGQNFYPNKNFPSNHFEVALCLASTNEICMLEVYNYGEKLKPLRTIAANGKWDLMANPNYPDPENFTIISGKLEDFEHLVLGK